MTGSTLKFNERLFVIVLCLLGVVRVLVFSAVFPFFNNVDEVANFDLVYQIRNGSWPLPADAVYDPATAHLDAIYGSPEFLRPATAFPNGVPAPGWKQPRQGRAQRLAANLRFYLQRPNHEAHSPPLYFALAAAWLAAGDVVGLPAHHRVYWVRSLNSLLLLLLIVLTYQAGRRWFPDRAIVRLGATVLVAILPQDTYYSVSADTLTPVLALISVDLAVRWFLGSDTTAISIGLGLAVAATFLTRVSALPVVLAFLLIVGIRVSRLIRSGAGWRRLVPAMTTLSVAAVPVALWMGHNLVIVGDLSGSSLKTEALGFSSASLSTIITHPIFTPAGWWTYISGLSDSFWRGEVVWMLEPVATVWADATYVLLSAVFLMLACISHRIPAAVTDTRRLDLICWLIVIGSILELALLSLAFDFEHCYYPSAEHPFMTSGRLISAATVPFAVLFARGVEVLTGFLRCRFVPAIVYGFLTLVIATSEISATLPVFLSRYNWFHLP